MADDNNRNLLFFESQSMKGLYEIINEWQEQNRKRLLSINIQQDDGKFSCIALTNPSEVIICDGGGGSRASVVSGTLITG